MLKIIKDIAPHSLEIFTGVYMVGSTSLPLTQVGKFTNFKEGGGGTLGISGWGCAAGTLELLTYTRASSAKFWYPLLE